jgi:hypothetical protein
MNTIQVALDYYELMKAQREIIELSFKARSAIRVRDQIADSLPANEPFAVYVHNPGEKDQDAVVVLGNVDTQHPGIQNAGDWQELGVGRNPNKELRSNALPYLDLNGNAHEAKVYGRPSRPAPPSVAREPRGSVGPGHDVLRDGGELPARGDLDPDHPFYREPGSWS